jgi:hypothetical protein
MRKAENTKLAKFGSEYEECGAAGGGGGIVLEELLARDEG